jgi:putative ABC transport system ATP-binding protein
VSDGLELRDVVKHYASGDGELVRAVDGVSVEIPPGEFVALYGPSGSGKTTLLLMAAGLLAPDAGTILFDGQRIDAFSLRESTRYRRRQVGLVFQSFHLTPGASAAENAGLKLQADGWTTQEACEAARPWLERVGLAERADYRVEQLSMGECQRVAIARALVNEPRLLLADEPTGNLDSKRSRETLGLLRDLCHERSLAVLLVTHDPQATAFVDRVFTLRDGQLTDGLDVDLAAVWTT